MYVCVDVGRLVGVFIYIACVCVCVCVCVSHSSFKIVMYLACITYIIWYEGNNIIV